MSTYNDVAIGYPASRDASQAQFLSGLLRPLRAWRERQQVRAELEALDPRTLADIGIHRCDFPAIVAGTYRDRYGR